MAPLKTWLSPDTIKNLFNKTIDAIFAIILLFITLTMIIGVARLFLRIGELLQKDGITGSYLYIFADVLTLFILIELSRSLFDYFSSNKLPLIPIIDAGIVFVIRHVMIDLFNHKLETENIYALSALLLALGIIRIGTSLSTYQENRQTPTENEPTSS